eukprot:9015918-Alexandrium_andersonii.AAC.1
MKVGKDFPWAQDAETLVNASKAADNRFAVVSLMSRDQITSISKGKVLRDHLRKIMTEVKAFGIDKMLDKACRARVLLLSLIHI